MKEIVVILHGEATNNAVISMPGRRYPGVVIQGDTLRNLVQMSEAVVSCARELDNDDLQDEAEGLYDALRDIYRWYEREVKSDDAGGRGKD